MTEEQIRALIKKEIQQILFDMQFLDGRNIQTGRGVGTKIGTATDQKVSVYGVTPTAQQSSVTDASVSATAGAGTVNVSVVDSNFTSCKNAINAIIDRLQAFGIIA